MKHWICLLLMGPGSLHALAQLNESDTVHLQVRTALTGNYQGGNVEVLSLRSRLDLVVSPARPWVFKSQNSGLYQSFYSRKADGDLFSRNYCYYQPRSRVYPLAIAYVSTNYRRKIALRYFAGGGLSAQLLRRGRHVLKLSAGAVYEHSRFSASTFNQDHYDGSPTIALWRLTTWLGGGYVVAGNRLRLYYDAYWQPAFSDGHNYRWQADLGVEFPIWQGLNGNLFYTYTHENLVVTRVRRDDRLLTFGLSYTLRTNHSR